jgi:DNA gyrase subunit A
VALEQSEKIHPVMIEEELKNSYLDYSMSVIVGRALPDVRDGLKPVHRRILFAMSELSLSYNRPYKKTARIVGEVLGKYHPHGESAVYDTLVRMVQNFSLRYPLVDGQGNFGSVDGDPPAAMRYTEARLARVADEMLRDIDKETVAWGPNFDGTLKEPLLLPATLPQLLVNGSSGIAVGMATNIPPHNLGEVVDALVAVIDEPALEEEKLLSYVKGPDFPTGGTIHGVSGIREAYRTGRGRAVIRAKAQVETFKSGKEAIVVTEIPFEVNKSTLIEKIAELARNKKIDGISDLRDESDRDGMRIVIETKRDADTSVVLNQLYKHTAMQTTYGIILLALVKNQPRILPLRRILDLFLEHRQEVVVRRTKFELAEAERRAHILEGLKTAIDHIDEIVAIIKKAKDVDAARETLMKRFKLSEVQAQAILDMTLKRLTGLERQKIEEEYLELIKFIAKLKSILASKAKVLQLIKDELFELKKKYGDERRTEILMSETEDFSIEDLIAEEDMVITISHQGYIKRLPVTTYRRQGRGGKGVTGVKSKEDDWVEGLFIASTHEYILFFTDRGRCYWLKVYEIPEGGRLSRGKPVVQLVGIGKDERMAAYVPVKEFKEGLYLIMASRQGTVKKSDLLDYSHPKRGGIIAAKIRDDDSLIDVRLTDGTQDVILATHEGQAVRFHESDARPMGRVSTGVRGVRLEKGDYVIGMVDVKREGSLLVVTENGMGKRSEIADYRVTRRGGKGVITVRVTDKTGKMVTIKEVVDSDELMIITQQGQVIRLPLSGVRVMGRATQGVKLINLDEGDRVVDVARVVVKEEEGTENGGNGTIPA